jgi:PEP-CTERM motif
MKLNSTLVLIALAFAGVSASAAANVEQFTLPDHTTAANPTVGPDGAAAHGNFDAAGAVDDVYNFNIAAVSDLLTYAKEFESLNVSLDPANFALFNGSFGDSGTQVGDTFSFGGGTALTTTYSNLAAGNYYFEITGDATGFLGADYDFAIFANTPGGPLPAVPEPANMALLLAGLGLVGFMAKRRTRQ